MWDFLFEVVDENSDLCGEQFFVECDTLREARQIAAENFEVELKYLGKYSIEEAEMWGLDTY